MSRRRMRVGIWNVEHGRHDLTVARHCAHLLTKHRLDAIVLTETREYARELNEQPGCRFLHFTEKPGQADTGILVADGISVSQLRIVHMTRDGWITALSGHRTPDKWMVTAILDGWLELGALHRAPSVRFDGDRTPEGPVRRVASTVQHARSEVRWVGRQPGDQALVVAGDWNDTPNDRGRYSPHWVARETGLELAAPKRPTHGRRTIDFALVRGVTGGTEVHPQPGSKHHLMVYDLTEETRP